MEFNGNEVILSSSERTRSDYPSPLDLSGIDLRELADDVELEESRLEAMKGADDDELTHSERAMIALLADKIAARRQIIGEIVVHKGSTDIIRGLEEFLKRSGES